jgi:hypothetical protein
MLHTAIAVALLLIFLFGVFHGRIARVRGWLSGLKTLPIAGDRGGREQLAQARR